MNRDEVWAVLFQTGGDRDRAAGLIGRSVRTLNRYIQKFDLYPDLDIHGMIKNEGPPRYGNPPKREASIVCHIHMNCGKVDASQLAVEIYGVSNEVTLARVYTALHEMKAKGILALDNDIWFVV